MDTCEILIVLLVIIVAVVPLAIVMTMVELLNSRKMANGNAAEKQDWL